MKDPRVRHLWHPCSQMKDYETFPPLEISGAENEYLILNDGTRIIYAISSWWCKSLGHGNERIKNAVTAQMESFEHVILANTSNSVIRELSSRLCSLMPGLDKVFYGGDGSTAVEIAAKMAVHANVIKGKKDKNRFMGLENGYHGETVLTLALSDLGLYKEPYENICQNVEYIKSVPYLNSSEDEMWEDCGERWPEIEAQLEKNCENLCAVVFEPVVQGAGGMLMYSPDFLRRLRKWADEKEVYLIADEIMTGFGRTGRAFACEHAGIVPDFVCVSKGLTAGWLPMSAVLTKSDIYDLFYDDYSTYKAFMHSNTYAGNALAAAAAVEALKIYEEENIFRKVEDNFPFLLSSMKEVAEATGVLENIRGVGAVVAADLNLPPSMEGERAGYAIYRNAVTKGALLRPLGNTVYWFPPLNISESSVNKLRNITISSIKEVFSS